MTKPILSKFLLRRGMLLIAVELLIINFAWKFSFIPKEIMLAVIWAIGFSMICLAGLIWLPRNILLTVAIVLIVGHNLLDPFPTPEGTVQRLLWALLHYKSHIPIGQDFSIYLAYPVIPWIGLMALGFFCGKWFNRNEMTDEARKRFLMTTGVGLITIFVLLRLWNGYGDPNPWQIYKGHFLMTVKSFINLTKYPPSLLYILMTIGPALLVLNGAEHWRGCLYNVLVTFGKVPFFYYIMHIYVIHLAYRISGMFMGYHWDESPTLAGMPGKFGVTSVGWIWGIALLTLCALYPLVARFAQLKSEKRSPIFSYF